MQLRGHFFLSVVLLIALTHCKGQHTEQPANNTTADELLVGGPFENKELLYVGMPERLHAVDTSAAWNMPGQRLLITGTMYQNDAKTPAPDVILYYYQTNTDGVYAPNEQLHPEARRHGALRGWVKTDENGHYAIYTLRPGAYPNAREPAHIHPTIKEPNNRSQYYLDAFVFDDDPLLTTKKRQALANRGGSGVLRLLQKGDLQIAEHDIILGLNIPDYPQSTKETVQSGKKIGEDMDSFTPYHAWGPDKGTTTCPVCKYGRYHGLLYFVGNNPDWSEIKKWLKYLEQEGRNRKATLKAYFIYGNTEQYDAAERRETLASLGAELGLEQLALTFVPSFSDTKTEIDRAMINQKVANTIVLYRNRSIIDKFVDLKATRGTLKSFRIASTKPRMLFLNCLLFMRYKIDEAALGD